MVAFAKERFAQVINDIKPLLPLHHTELALYQGDIAFDPDYAKYDTLDTMGVIKIYTVRADDGLIGYAIYVVMPHMHYRQNVWARCDLIWIKPEYRRAHIGKGLLAFVEAQLALEGVSVMHTTGKTAHPELLALLLSEGHEHTEFGCSKRLKGP